MRFQRTPLRETLLIAAVLGMAACGGDGAAPNSGGGGGGGGGGGPVGAIVVGNTFFRSSHNGTTNPAIDTVPAGTLVTWTWTSTGTFTHSVRSTGSTFTSSGNQTGNGSTHTYQFDTPGTYEYDCAVHPGVMTGRIVVQ